MKVAAYTVAGAVYRSSVEGTAYRTELEDRVNELIQQRWQPHGSLQVLNQSDGLLAFQPMVRYEP